MRAIGVLIIAAMSGVIACGSVMALSVGDLAPVVDTPDAEAGISLADTFVAPQTLVEKLEARCAGPSGSPDYFESAAELSQKLVGRWYACTRDGGFGFPVGNGVNIEFAATTGSYAFTTVNDAGTDFVPSTDPDFSGEVFYVAFAGTPSDGGGGEGGDASALAASDGSTEIMVPVNDMVPRNGFFVYMTRATDDDLEILPAFEQMPRRMRLQELGGDPATGVFVPVD